MSEAIERCLAAEKWKAARKLIETRLRETPDNHYLIARLAITYYQERNYKRALRLSLKAVSLAPHCPLVLWDCAGALEMLGKTGEAIGIYRRLIKRGVRRIAYGKCGEGMAWARRLIADCHYRMGRCYMRLGRNKDALAEFNKHIRMRRSGCRSIYRITTVRRDISKVRKRLKAKRESRGLQVT